MLFTESLLEFVYCIIPQDFCLLSIHWFSFPASNWCIYLDRSWSLYLQDTLNLPSSLPAWRESIDAVRQIFRSNPKRSWNAAPERARRAFWNSPCKYSFTLPFAALNKSAVWKRDALNWMTQFDSCMQLLELPRQCGGPTCTREKRTFDSTMFDHCWGLGRLPTAREFEHLTLASDAHQVLGRMCHPVPIVETHQLFCKSKGIYLEQYGLVSLWKCSE